MITIVYVSDEGYDVLLGAFLMREDANIFMKNSNISTLKIKEVEAWEGWSVIRDKM
tara:strand:- start:3349 stop:3516 length:168 start_codon:yes stop_codon:yes gene_type:complete